MNLAPSRVHQDGSKILSGGADNAGRMFDVTTGQASQVAQHDAPIRVVRWIESPQGSVLATGSWDKTVKVSRLLSLYLERSSCQHCRSTGTCVNQLLYLPYSSPSAAIPWMFNTP